MLMASAGTGAALLVGDLVRRYQGGGHQVGLEPPGNLAGPTPTQSGPLLTRTIPSTGETIPAVGLGSARRIGPPARAAMKEVLRLFREAGGSVFDTAPTYGAAESEAGALAQELGIENDLFFATKISTGGGREAGIRQQDTSMRLWGRETIDLNQVHSLQDVGIHLPTIRHAKEQGRTRYVGITISRLEQFEHMEQLMRTEAIDFIQINYSLGVRQAADRILPLAQDRGLGVLINEPYNAGTLFRAVGGEPLPGWAADFDCESWGQFFLKYILAHPAVTAVIPATADPEHLIDNLGAGVGGLPDQAMRSRMEEFFDRL